MANVGITRIQNIALDRWLGDSAVKDREIELAWVGQAGFIIQSPELTVSIDLYLSDILAQKYAGTEFPHKRMAVPPVSPESLRSTDFLLSSHGHTDHMDPETIGPIYEENLDGPKFICPRSQTGQAVQRNVPAEMIIGINSDESFSLMFGSKEIFRVTAIPSAHERLVVDDYGNYEALGYVIEIGGFTIYHSGDCVPYEGLEERLGKLAIDIALLPVNGRDAYRTSRGILGNFTAEEASLLARNAGIPCLIPHHYGMFDFNTVGLKNIESALLSDNWVIGKDAAITAIGNIYTVMRS